MKNNKYAAYRFRKRLLFFCIGLALFPFLLGFPFWYQQKCEAAIPLNGCFIYEEAVVALAKSGDLLPCYPQGMRIAKGDIAAVHREFTLGGVKVAALRAPAAGIVFYETDGLENVLSLGSVPNYSATKLLTAAGEGEYAPEAGMKIMDNHAPVFLLTLFSQEQAQTVDLRDRAMLSVDGVVGEGYLLKKYRDGEKIVCLWRMEASAPWFKERFAAVRIASVL